MIHTSPGTDRWSEFFGISEETEIRFIKKANAILNNVVKNLIHQHETGEEGPDVGMNIYFDQIIKMGKTEEETNFLIFASGQLFATFEDRVKSAFLTNTL